VHHVSARWAGEGGLLGGAFSERYRIEQEIGHGAMARVYLARDLRLERPVAVKMLNPELSAALGPERFLREIEILTHLNHPHILLLLDKGEADDGRLCYVMPYIAGESLRHRLRRETQLRIDDAIAIARDVAAALDYAHRQGIVHRDIKPENILMSEGLALVADFGIARAITLSADDETLTQAGVSPGTPPYMSPEQASGGDVDGRSDIYALGCVLYELLAGQPPFTGPTTQAILARHLADPVPPLRTVRNTVSVGLEQVVLKALEKVPADRFATAAEFARALTVHTTHGRGNWRLPTAVGAAAAVVGIVVWFASRGWSATAGGTALDTTRYAILPSERDSGLASFNEDQLLQDAFGHWTGIDVVDPFQVKDAMARRQGSLSSEEARSVATGLAAGRYVRTEMTRVGDSVRIHGELYDANRQTRLRDATVMLGSDSTHAAGPFASLAERLLFDDAGPGRNLDGRTGTRSFPARVEFARGLDSIYTWNLMAADSAFKAATEYDPMYWQAHLWLAQVRYWNDTITATWRSSAERAAAGRASLTDRDRLLSDALVAFGRTDVVSACAAWQTLTGRAPYDFTGWYGLATCLSQDEAVLRDAASPSGWRFRSSYYRATRAYERAFELLPSIHKTLSADSYAAVRRLLKTNASSTREGKFAGLDTTTFVAFPSWQHDTLGFVPFPQTRVSEPQVIPADIAVAVRHQRELFREIATAWVTAFPQSAEALEALAVSYDMLEDPTAIEKIRQARGLAKTDDQRVRLAGTEAWMRVMLSVPSDTAALIPARALTESLLALAAPKSTVQPLLLASLAGLTGRSQLAVELTRSPLAAANFDVPPPLAASGLPLLVFAASGGPPDSLRTLEQQVDATINQRFGASVQQEARMRWLVRPARLAFPDYRFSSFPRLVSTGDYLIGAEAAFLRGDTLAVLEVFSQARAVRRFIPPSDLNLEGLYPEARLLTAVGDSQAAIDWLEGRLRALPATDPQSFVNPANAIALVRAMALRADLAKQAGDPANARRWARVVALLWSDCDPFLRPLVLRMRRMAGTT
jgi:tRNA A-37 threonylcarbamoyl transferase component Bud32